MGCASSKQRKPPPPPKCKHCSAPYSPVRRSYSVHAHPRPSTNSITDDDSYHLVALQSSTLGSLRLDEFDFHRPISHNNDDDNTGGCHHHHKNDDAAAIVDKKAEFELGMVQAKAWSQMIDEKITRVVPPRTPVRTPPGEPEMIDAWEMMDGLEDTSPLLHRVGERVRSFSFHVRRRSTEFPDDFAEEESEKSDDEDEGEEEASPDSIWVESNNNDKNINGKDWLLSDSGGGQVISTKNLVSEFDPEIITAFRKALQELSPKHPFHLINRNCNNSNIIDDHGGGESNNGDDDAEEGKKKMMMMDGVLPLPLPIERDQSNENKNPEEIGVVHQQHHNHHLQRRPVLLYFTSLRGVRKTYENCCDARLILKSLGVKVDERDVSMHSAFKEELQHLMMSNNNNNNNNLDRPCVALPPQLFLGDTHIGGAEEIRKLHEDGELEKVLGGCERMKEDEVVSGLSCDACGDIRFVPCETCSGSCKIYYEEEEEDEDEEVDNEEVIKCVAAAAVDSGFQRCPDCNENGLIRCPFCCYH